MKTYKKLLLATASLLSFSAIGIQQSVAAEFNLNYASPYSEAHPYGAADAEWIKRIEEQTDGRVKLTPFWGRSLITSREGVDELSAGVADVAYIAPIYARSGYDLNRIVPSFFYGYTEPLKVLSVYLGLREEHPEFNTELKGVHVLGYNVGTPMHLLLREKPVNTLDDLKGLRIRSAADFVGPLEQYGAEGVTMPMTETYPALEKGVVDGVIAPYEALASLSFAEVIKFYSELPHSRGAYPSRAMNGASWDSLPDDIKTIFNDNIQWLSERTVELSTEAANAGRAKGEEHGVVFNSVSDEVKAEYATVFAPVAQKKAEAMDAKGLPGTAILEAIRAAYE